MAGKRRGGGLWVQFDLITEERERALERLQEEYGASTSGETMRRLIDDATLPREATAKPASDSPLLPRPMPSVRGRFG